jgi:hypothetical protein
MKKLAHIIKGVRAGRMVEMPAEDLETAISEGWAEPVGNNRRATVPTRGPHKKADAYFEKAADEADKRRGVGRYSNRMLETGGPSERPKRKPEPAAPIIDVGPAPPEPNAPEAPEEVVKPRGPGRPKKSEQTG